MRGCGTVWYAWAGSQGRACDICMPLWWCPGDPKPIPSSVEFCGDNCCRVKFGCTYVYGWLAEGDDDERDKCGPEITLDLWRILALVRARYNTLATTNPTRLRRACRSIDPLWLPGDVDNPYAHWFHAVYDAWDIEQLRDGDFTGYQNRCATGKCIRTVMVRGKCYTDAAVNYVLFGLIANLCHRSSLWTVATAAAGMPLKMSMGLFGLTVYTPASALSALKWAVAGWGNYPIGSKEPPEERPECPACGLTIPCPGSLSVMWDNMSIF